MWHSQLYTLTEPQNVVGNINHPHEGNFGFDIDDNTQISDIAIFGSGRIRGGDGNAEGGVGLNGRFGTGHEDQQRVDRARQRRRLGRPRLRQHPRAAGDPGDGARVHRHAHPQHLRRRHQLLQRHPQLAGVQLVVPHHRRRRAGGLGQPVRQGPARSTSRHDNHFVNNTDPAAVAGQRHRHLRRLRQLDREQPRLRHDELPRHHAGDRPRPAAVLGHDADRQQRRSTARGGAFWNEDQEFGAITLFPSTLDITGVTIRDTDIYDSTYDGIQFKNGGGNMPNVAITNVRIDKSNNGAGILAMSGARGNATLTNVTITNSADGNIVIQPGIAVRHHGELTSSRTRHLSDRAQCRVRAGSPSGRPVEEADLHQLARGALADRRAQGLAQREPVRAGARRHQGRGELVAVERAGDLDRLAGAEQLRGAVELQVGGEGAVLRMGAVNVASRLMRR